MNNLPRILALASLLLLNVGGCSSDDKASDAGPGDSASVDRAPIDDTSSADGGDRDAAANDTRPDDSVPSDADAVDVAFPSWDARPGCAVESDVYLQAANRKVDFLFVLDAAGSMDRFQQAVSGAGGALAASAAVGNVDFHLGFITIDAETDAPLGQLLGTPTYLTTANNVAQTLTQLLLSADHGPEEKTFDAVQAAITPPLSTGANAGFRRADASLEVVTFTDEPDGSVLTRGQATALFAGLTNASAQVFARFHAVIPEGDCNDGTAFPKLEGVAEETGGTTGDLCAADQSAVMKAIADRSFGLQDQFPLSKTPADVNALVVRVDGATVSHTYLSGTNSVLLSPAPADGARIAVSYEVCP